MDELKINRALNRERENYFQITTVKNGDRISLHATLQLAQSCLYDLTREKSRLGGLGPEGFNIIELEGETGKPLRFYNLDGDVILDRTLV